MSKKALVRFDPKKPARQSGDFLAPFREKEGGVYLASIKTGKPVEYGLVVFTGREVTSNDVFAKLVDTGHKVLAATETLTDLESFVAQLSSCNIGAVVQLENSPEYPRGFHLKMTTFKSGTAKPHLP